MRAAYLLSPSIITRGRMGASKAALILMKNSHFDRTLQYAIAEPEIIQHVLWCLIEVAGLLLGTI